MHLRYNKGISNWY